jgi:primosomal protein N' (replication factor Y)
MVTKGLDFDNVSIVGILNADNMLNYPDFRSPERSYQLMAQVSGRAGRKKKRGKVIIQTYTPYHSVILDVIDNNYHKNYQNILLERRNFNYPPFYRLVEISLKYKEYNLLNEASEVLAKMLREPFGKNILGPEYPIVSRIKNKFIKSILVKIPRDKSLIRSKEILAEQITAFKKLQSYKSVQIVLDVDPQ